jgi:hypothetical protein
MHLLCVRLLSLPPFRVSQIQKFKAFLKLSMLVRSSRLAGCTLLLLQPALPLPPPGKAWGEFGNGSGLGSDLYYTVTTRSVLQQLIEELDVNSLVDCPCGAMAWM